MSRDARSKQTIAKGLASKVNDYCDPRFYMASDEDGDSAKALDDRQQRADGGQHHRQEGRF